MSRRGCSGCLVDLLGRARDEARVYGSGGFTSYPLAGIREQVGSWVELGITQVKMKVSREPERDPERLDAARQASGDETELYVDSNGALSRKQALAWAARIAREWGVTWYEEPVSSADLEGLRFLRAGALAAAFDLDLSAHCAPSASVDACCAVPRFRCLEWFHDHVRLEPPVSYTHLTLPTNREV